MITSARRAAPLLHPHRRVTPRHAQDHDFAEALGDCTAPDGDYDVLLFGATGFTGLLAAEYLARHAPRGCRWALAGRDRPRLDVLRGRLAVIDPRCAELPIVIADAAGRDGVPDLAQSTRVVITAVGPELLT